MSMYGWQALHSLTRDASVKERRLTPGTTRRVLGYARPYKVAIAWFLGLVVVESVLVVATPLLLKSLIDDGIYPKDSAVVVRLSLYVAAIAVVSARPHPRRALVLRPHRGGTHLRPAHRRCSPTCCASPSRSSPGPRPAPS